MPRHMSPESKAKAKAYMEAYREKHKDRLAEQNKASCKRRYYANHEANKATARESYRADIELSRAKDRACRQRTKPAVLARAKRYVEQNRERVAASKKGWREANRETIRAKRQAQYAADPEKHKRRANEWRKANPEKRTAILAKRRARKAGAAVGADREAYKAFIRSVRRAESVTCYWCGRFVPKGEREIHHIVPLARRGPDDVHNLCCACEHCNCSKGDKLPEEFSGQHLLQFCGYRGLGTDVS